jgi:hypothetical protein
VSPVRRPYAHITRAEKKLAEKGLAAQRPAVCHGDFHPGNTLWSGVRLVAVIDFDSARHESVAAEVANAMLQFSLKHRVGENPDAWQIGLDTDRLRAFCAGYCSEPALVPPSDQHPARPQPSTPRIPGVVAPAPAHQPAPSAGAPMPAPDRHCPPHPRPHAPTPDGR